jgi:hypothetical protein
MIYRVQNCSRDEKPPIHFLRKSVGFAFLFPFNTTKLHVQTIQGLVAVP